MKKKALTRLLRITSPYYVAGIVVDKFGNIRQCAPILYWMKKKQFKDKDIFRFCRYKKYEIETIPIKRKENEDGTQKERSKTRER